MDNLAFLDEPQGSDTAAVVEAPIEPATLEPVAPEAPPASEAAPAEVVAPAGTADEARNGAGGAIPLGTLLDERERRQVAERKLAALEAEQRAPQAPNFYDDPEAYAAWHAQVTQQTVLNTRLDLQEDAVRRDVGDDAVDAARDWVTEKVRTNPSFYTEMMSQRNPWAYVVERHKRESLVSTIEPDELEKFRAWQTAQADAQAGKAPAAVQTAAPPTQQPPRAPQSITSMPSAGGVQHVVIDPEAAFDSVFRT